MTRAVLAAVLIIVLLLGVTASFTVNETEQVVITRLQKPVRKPITEPGIHFKLPFVETANYFPKYLMEWDGDPGELTTRDKTLIWVDTFARWRISDPLVYFKTVVNERGALSKLDDIVDSAVRNAITSHRLIESVRNANRSLDDKESGMDEAISEWMPSTEIQFGREKITRMILEGARPKLAEFGIDLVDVRIKRINYREEVQKAVFDRMIQERKQIAEKYRSEGRGESNKIVGQMEKELKKITSEAYRSAQEIKGKADAEAAHRYAEAFSRDPEFYSFLNTLEGYRLAVDDNTWLLLSTDSEFFRYFKSYAK